MALKREKGEKETIIFLPRAKLRHVFHSSPTGVIFCAHMLTTGKLRMKQPRCKKHNGNTAKMIIWAICTTLWWKQLSSSASRVYQWTPPSQPPTVPAKIRQIKLHYSRQSCSWPLKWFYVNYPNGYALKATVFLIYSKKKSMFGQVSVFFSLFLPHVIEGKNVWAHWDQLECKTVIRISVEWM